MFGGNTNPARKPASIDPPNDTKVKNITKGKLVHMIDSLLEKDSISLDELDQLNYLNDQLKFEKKAELVHLIDSLLEKEHPTHAEIAQLNLLSGLKPKTLPGKEIDLLDLEKLHAYSVSEENKLFPLYSLDSIPNDLNILLENPQTQNYSNPFNGVLTSYYGWRDKRMHKGIDIDLNKGQPVAAAFDGKVRIAAKNNGGFGNVVIIMHANGLETVYAHLSKIKVKPGQIVLSGQTIGLGGNTGRSRGSHLHFETRYKGHALNPLCFIQYNENKLYHHSITLKVIKKTLVAFPSNAELHTIKKGESWNLIAQKYHTPVSKLITINGSARRYYLRPGTPMRVN
jgi:murein DD-endopeptidase MepM/ murein hydrolase activator NlpD